MNLYGFVGNDGVNTWDYLGLDYHHWFAQIGGEGQALANEKCPGCDLDIDDYTTWIEGGFKGSPHGWIHGTLKYHVIYRILGESSRNCCEFLVRTQALMYATWWALSVRQNLVDPFPFPEGRHQNFFPWNFSLIRRKTQINTLPKFKQLLLDQCNRDTSGEASALATLLIPLLKENEGELNLPELAPVLPSPILPPTPNPTPVYNPSLWDKFLLSSADYISDSALETGAKVGWISFGGAAIVLTGGKALPALKGGGSGAGLKYALPLTP